MKVSDQILKVNNLEVSFFTLYGEVKAVRNISFAMKRGEMLGIVGESGSGKSVTALSVLRLLQEPGRTVGGEILFNGENLANKSNSDMRYIRNSQIAMVFQDPMTSLNPTLKIGTQIIERIRAFKKGISKNEANKIAEKLLEMVKIPEPRKRLDAYPFELSGGMRQRVMFAVAIACNPQVLVADEPTTALDVTIQNQILKLMKQLKREIDTSTILITHDLGVVAETCDRVIVMYGGMIMEEGTVDEIFYDSAHPYTIGLKKSIPNVDDDDIDKKRLYSIAGSPPNLLNPPKGCVFAGRCTHAMHICSKELPPYVTLSDTHRSMCWLLDEGCPNNFERG